MPVTDIFREESKEFGHSIHKQTPKVESVCVLNCHMFVTRKRQSLAVLDDSSENNYMHLFLRDIFYSFNSFSSLLNLNF